MKSWERRTQFWRRVVSAVLCAVLLSTNMAGAFASEEPGNQPPPGAEENLAVLPDASSGTGEESLCEHHPAHDEACGWTAENPVCGFACPICPVRERIDGVLAGVAELEALDEASVEQLRADARAAVEAYNLLPPDQQAQIAGIDAVRAFLEPANAQPDGGGGEPLPGAEKNPPVPDASSGIGKGSLCAHHPAHDEACGWTAENPVCGFVCPVCPVQELIDGVLAQMEELTAREELDEASVTQFYAQARAAMDAYDLLSPEWRAWIDEEQIQMLAMILDTLNIQLTASDPSIEVTAEIRAAGEDAQKLAGSNASFQVNFAKQVTLHIEVESSVRLTNKTVKISVPDGLIVVDYPIPNASGMVAGVSPESPADLRSDNTYGAYCPQSGTVTYTLKNESMRSSFNIILAADTTLWNRKPSQVIGETLTITASATEAADSVVSATANITGKYLNNADRALQTGPRLRPVGVKNGVPTAADQPFAMRQVWLNPDKDYIAMAQFFKKLEITIALPYYEDTSKNKVYAEFDSITYDPAGASDRPNLLDPKNHQNDSFEFTKTDNSDHTVTLTWENLYLEYGEEYFTPYFKWTEGNTPSDNTTVIWGSSNIRVSNDNKGNLSTTSDAPVGGKITWQNLNEDENEQENEWYFFNKDFTCPYKVRTYNGESVKVTGKSRTSIYNANNPNFINYLGQFQVVNHGGTDSEAKTVEFTYGNTDKIGVTAQRIPATTGNEVEIWYQTDKTTDGKWTYYGTLKSVSGCATLTAKLAGLPEGEYFTKIRANVGSYDKDYVGYVSSRPDDPTSGYGATFGKLLTNEAGAYSNFATMKMWNTPKNESEGAAPADPSTQPVTAAYNVEIKSTKGKIPLGMERAYKQDLSELAEVEASQNEGHSLEREPILSETAATAGRTVTFNGLIGSSAYPYTDKEPSSNAPPSNMIEDPEIYIRLPEKITVENLKLYNRVGSTADKLFLFDAVVETGRPTATLIPEAAYTMTVTNLEDSSDNLTYKQYKITFNQGYENYARIGWFTDGLGQYQIGISFDMKIANDADAMTLDMRDCVRVESKSLECITNDGTMNQYLFLDGQTNKKFASFNVNEKDAQLSVLAARRSLTFTFGARMVQQGDPVSSNLADYTNYGNDNEKVFLKDQNHVVDMMFTMKNETGRAFKEADAKAFQYFIPVPKEGDYWDSHMQDQAFEFSMKLRKAPEVSGISKDNILVTYSATVDSTVPEDAPLHYSNKDNYKDNYKTEAQLLEGCTTDEQKAEAWSRVKMIRIAAKDDVQSIRDNAELIVDMRCVPEGMENADLVGSTVNFGPCGISTYTVGDTTNKGHSPLPRIWVEFQTGVIEGTVFIDKNYNGVYDEAVDELYTGGVTVEAKRADGSPTGDIEDHISTVENGVFRFYGRRAADHHVTVINPGSENLTGSNPLKFSLPETGGAFQKDTNKNAATATVVLEKGRGEEKLAIGFQRPHTVTFTAPNASPDKAETKVWHGGELGTVPTVTANANWRFTGKWISSSGEKYDSAELQALEINADAAYTAEVKPLYWLRYDGNGNTAGSVPESKQYLAGEQASVLSDGTRQLKKGSAIFAGWSLDRITDVLKAGAAQEVIQKIIIDAGYTMPDRDVTLYAVWAEDANGNGRPDYAEDAVHARYHSNNGGCEDVVCPHYHVVGTKKQLSANGTVSGRTAAHGAPASSASATVTNHTFTYDGNVFVGWSMEPVTEVIATRARYEALKARVVTEVTMLAKDGGADADGNTNVYAVWAADRNGNGTADYLEERRLRYDGNARSSGSVSGVPVDETIYLPGDKAVLSAAVPGHSDVNGKRVLFIGWTEGQTNSIYSRADAAPETVSEVVFTVADRTVYAAWGYDEDNDGTADVLETYSLTYDLNGGKETPPAGRYNVKKGTEILLTANKNFTRNENEIFAGWSRTKHEGAFTKEQGDEVNKILITTAIIRMGTEDVTLYAVWAEDVNEPDDVPDYKTTWGVIYNLNGGVPAPGVSYEREDVEFNALHTIKAQPERDGYRFAGWRDHWTGTTYQPGEKITVTADLNLIAQWIKTDGTSVETTYNGKEQPLPDDLVGEGDDVTVEYRDENGDPLTNPDETPAVPKDAGTYTAVITEKDEDGNVIGVTEVTYIIKPAVLTAVYEGETVNVGGTPAGKVQVTGFVNGETAETAEGYRAPTVTGSDTGKAGTYDLTPAGGDAKNYIFEYKSGTLTVRQPDTPRPPEPDTPSEPDFPWVWPEDPDPTPPTPTPTPDPEPGAEDEPGAETEPGTGTGPVAPPAQPGISDRPVDPFTGMVPYDPAVILDDLVPLAAPHLNVTDHYAYAVGYANGLIRPEGDITRAEAATIFFRLMQDDYRLENWATENDFPDVNSGDWYNNAVSTCAKAGIITGYEDGYFRPNAAITRAEFAAIAARFVSDDVPGYDYFTDMDGHWAQADVARAVMAGWIKGDGRLFRPEDRLTRAETTTMVNRMISRFPDKEHLLPEMIIWPDNPKDKWYYEDIQEATNSHDYEQVEFEFTEIWTILLANRDWAALEKEWADAAAAPGGEVAPDLRPGDSGSEDEPQDITDILGDIFG